ncbi:purine operon repressor, PurR [Marininema mesophilum]|uniref:Purine operon repressor, PurR n=1 Tax=Marininema mesophilum TaxID=1048340 RepID=A0A1H2WZK4_9BACL|nr:pur operon repressor [Marininema mesophilum]SDW86025.1 purine operon repressor, PurR [Marininema mesophilum]
MKKWKRSARLVDMTRQLLDQPHRLISLSAFADRYQAAKSSISEDLAIIHETFREEGTGLLETVSGAAGGVRYLPIANRENATKLSRQLCAQLENPDRILPGGYLYLSDLLGDDRLVREIGRIWATVFSGRGADVVVTVETKGIPLAYATASHLGLPVAIVRRDSRITEGSVVTINTVSGSSKRLGSLSLARRSFPEGARVLIVDDFMKAGGTVQGMIDLMGEFRAEVIGIGIMAESQVDERLVENTVSLATVTDVDVKNRKIAVELGNLFTQGGFFDGTNPD